MDELVFNVIQESDGGYVAEARSNGIATDGATWAEMRANVQDLITAYYECSFQPTLIAAQSGVL